MKQYNLGWGESVAIRHALLDSLKFIPPIQFGYTELANLSYPKHEGDQELVELTKKVIYRQMGCWYNNILITNGATGAVTIALRAFQQRGIDFCSTRQAPYFSLYPAMIRAAGMNHIRGNLSKCESIYLLDSPSNPQGEFLPGGTQNTIWDAVYYSKAYMSEPAPTPAHEILCGSYSKLLGLNGIRVGWIACDDNLLFERMRELVTAEYCGISAPSTAILVNILKNMTQETWESFEKKVDID